MSTDTDQPNPAVTNGDGSTIGNSMGSVEDLGAEATPPTNESLPTNAIFEVLCNRRRRDIIELLVDRDGESTTGELAEQIAAMENDKPVAQINSTERKRVYVGLYQNHLPKMHDIGVIDYDKNRGTVRLTDAAGQLHPYLQDPDPPEQGPRVTIGAVAALALVFLGGITAGIGGPNQLLLLMGVTVFAAVVTFDAVRDHRSDAVTG